MYWLISAHERWIIQSSVSPLMKRIKSLKQGAYEYNEDELLGEGSFALVYKGTITKNNRVVAVRLLPLKLIDQYGEKIKDIITGEVCVLKDLSLSDSIDSIFTTKIFDCFMTQHNVVMILEYCPEGNLEDVVKKGPIEEKEALEIIYQLSRGLQFIASEKVVHRDIKPDNIFIKKEGKNKIFKLGDFGFAVKKQLNHQIVGTPIFMSPELFREQKYGSEVDVWAFGLMVHYMLFKQYYFIGKTEQQIKKRVLGEAYCLKKHHLSKISNKMADFLTSCLQLDKSKRVPATKISEHAVFDPVRQRIENLIAEVRLTSSLFESQLSKKTAKRQLSNYIVKYSFLVDYAHSLSQIDRYNLASLYIYKHSLGELVEMRKKIEKKENVINHPEWNSFCTSEEFQKSKMILDALIEKCENSFEYTFSDIIPMVRSRYGDAVSNGIQQNLGNGPYERINPAIICHELQKTWYPRLQQNKTPESHLAGLQLILALHVYQNKPINFDYTAFEISKQKMSLKQRSEFLEYALKKG